MLRPLLILIVGLGLAACSTSDGPSSQPRAGDVDLSSKRGQGVVDTGETQTQRTMRMAERAMAEGKPEMAIAFYRTAALADPTNPEPRIASAALFEKTGEYKAAAGMYRQVASEQKNVDHWLAAGRNFLKAGMPNEAAAAYQVVIETEPRDARGHNGLAVSEDLRQEHTSAIALYEKAYDLADRDMRNGILVNWGLSLMLANRAGEAVQLLEPKVQETDLPALRQTLALAYGLSGQTEKAKELGISDPPTYEQLKASVREYGMGGPTSSKPTAAPRGDVVTVPSKR